MPDISGGTRTRSQLRQTSLSKPDDLMSNSFYSFKEKPTADVSEMVLPTFYQTSRHGMMSPQQTHQQLLDLDTDFRKIDT